MGDTIKVFNALTTATVSLGERKGLAGALDQEVHDGDTIKVRGDNFGVRFLGIDTPEISLQFPYPNKAAPGEKRQAYPLLSDPLWEDFLGDPFDAKWGPIQLDPALLKYLKQHTGRAAAINQYRWASKAREVLLSEIQTDMTDLGATEETFRFFLLFANEITDRYGRLLAYLRPDEPKVRKARAAAKSKAEKDKIQYKPYYNQRLAEAGLARPYFIWPNLDPFRKKSLRKAAMPPGELQKQARTSLTDVRNAVQAARAKGLGCYAKGTGLMLEPFELRALTRRQAPNRWVIDLGKDDDKLVAPHEYYKVANPEDRLFIDEDYLTLFTSNGWTPKLVAAPVVVAAPAVRTPPAAKG
jgi:endonuclease YncB( thermonuclease family)